MSSVNGNQSRKRRKMPNSATKWEIFSDLVALFYYKLIEKWALAESQREFLIPNTAKKWIWYH
jgi:hypothetical protein